MASKFSIEELVKAAATLREVLDFSIEVMSDDRKFRIARDACIQRFEYCIELAWKVALKKLGSQTKFPKPAIREMARADLIGSAELWLEFIEARNSSSHSYNEDVARAVYTKIVSFASELEVLLSKMRNMP